MKVANLVGSRFKEKPSDCVIDSHALMVRGGYMKYVGNGIYSEFPTLRRVTSKIENIIRQEMDAIDGQEVLFPVVLPAGIVLVFQPYPAILSVFFLQCFAVENLLLLLAGIPDISC